MRWDVMIIKSTNRGKAFNSIFIGSLILFQKKKTKEKVGEQIKKELANFYIIKLSWQGNTGCI